MGLLVKERPLSLNSSEVRAILGGIKTQIRLPIKPQPARAMEMPNRDFSPRGNFFVSDPVDGNRGRSGKCCPVGRLGEHLWVREPYNFGGLSPSLDAVRYRADGQKKDARWLPAVKMPRWASRLTLEITEVRVQRLQDISEEDAVAEGNPIDEPPWISPVEAFASRWDSTYDKRHKSHSWSANPWVWAVTLRTVP
jgi:hypothetical protein